MTKEELKNKEPDNFQIFNDVLSLDVEVTEESMDNSHGGRGRESYKNNSGAIVPTDEIVDEIDDDY